MLERICSGSPAGKVLDGVRGSGDSGPFPFQTAGLLTALQIRLGSPWRGELLCNTLPHITVRNFLGRPHFNWPLPFFGDHTNHSKMTDGACMIKAYRKGNSNTNLLDV